VSLDDGDDGGIDHEPLTAGGGANALFEVALGAMSMIRSGPSVTVRLTLLLLLLLLFIH
jgi:hypothetical protein